MGTGTQSKGLVGLGNPRTTGKRTKMGRDKLKEEQKIKLKTIADEIFSNYKGILAADERPSSLESRFSRYSIQNTDQNRLKFRKLLFTTPTIEDYIGGVIINEETFGQKDSNGKLLYEYILEKNIKVGIKLDKGFIDFDDNQKISIGLEDLNARIKQFKICSFAKWRSLFIIKDKVPTQSCINKNMKVLSKYAYICQRNGLVPIIEPEISFEGSYTIERMEKVARDVYSALYCYLNRYNVYIEGTILKISFITAGKDSNQTINFRFTSTFSKKGSIS